MSQAIIIFLECPACGNDLPNYICYDCRQVGFCSEECALADWENHYNLFHENDIGDSLDQIKIKDQEEPDLILARVRRRKKKTITKTKKWIKPAIEHEGSFTRKAKRRKMSTKKFMQKVLSNPKRYDTRTVRQANFMKRLLSFHHGGRRRTTVRRGGGGRTRRR